MSEIDPAIAEVKISLTQPCIEAGDNYARKVERFPVAKGWIASLLCRRLLELESTPWAYVGQDNPVPPHGAAQIVQAWRDEAPDVDCLSPNALWPFCNLGPRTSFEISEELPPAVQHIPIPFKQIFTCELRQVEAAASSENRVPVYLSIFKRITTITEDSLSQADLIVGLVDLIQRREDAVSPSESLWSLLSSCLRALYRAFSLKFNEGCLLELESSFRQSVGGLVQMSSHVHTLASLHARSPILLAELLTHGIHAVDRHSSADLSEQVISPPSRWTGFVDLLVSFPQPPYTSEAAAYCQKVAAAPVSDVRPYLPPPSSYDRISFSNTILPRIIIEGYWPKQIEDAVRPYFNRVRWLILDSHGSSEGLEVNTNSSAAIDASSVDQSWVKSLFSCVNPRLPNACVVLFSCEVGKPGGIAEFIHKRTGLSVLAPEGLASGLSLGLTKDGFGQFWQHDTNGLVPVSTRYLR
ncbi:hypothetical protein IPG41_03560 [Candidatus Peregrinibacteria bacterium]|nr:MAG: hypothetical protein IPG41_03560 [Candidatus Peregrinibacteria bacterium]